ncbi:Uncharacterised protein [Klebsiella aerogenes]|nr:Uncharacterised protein [Klebsiella aerogenes]
MIDQTGQLLPGFLYLKHFFHIKKTSLHKIPHTILLSAHCFLLQTRFRIVLFAGYFHWIIFFIYYFMLVIFMLLILL